LDVACGSKRTSRELARRGASVVGVDLSARLIELARASHLDADAGTYLVADVARTAEWWDGVSFDGAVCEMAFMDVDDVAGTLSAVAETLGPGAPFVVSMVHPCFPGNDAGLSSSPPDEGYTAEGFWASDRHNPEGVRLRVGSDHRMLSTYSTRCSPPASFWNGSTSYSRPFRPGW
jgi:SAM-dependent methyltransferase